MCESEKTIEQRIAAIAARIRMLGLPQRSLQYSESFENNEWQDNDSYYRWMVEGGAISISYNCTCSTCECVIPYDNFTNW